MNTKQETLGMWLGVLGVAIFAVTLPMTRLATGTTADPQLSAWFITFARAALAGGLSVVFLLVTRSPWPLSTQRLPLLMALLGNVIGFPLLLGLALRHVTSGHAAVFTALLPLATAAMSAWVLHQRARLLRLKVLFRSKPTLKTVALGALQVQHFHRASCHCSAQAPLR